MKCPKCKQTEILQEVNLKGTIFARRKIITFYCPLCDFKNQKQFKLSENEYQAELEKKGGYVI